MKILALDIATVTGYAIGVAGEIPRSGSVRLKKSIDHLFVAPFNMGCFIRDIFALDKPDLVAIEHFLNPIAQKSADAIILQLMCFGAAIYVCMSHGVRIQTAMPATIRKHFCGAANAGKRADTKRMVLNRAKSLRYIPADCTDDNRADACALFDYASAIFGRVQPKELVMFNEDRGES